MTSRAYAGHLAIGDAAEGPRVLLRIESDSVVMTTPDGNDHAWPVEHVRCTGVASPRFGMEIGGESCVFEAEEAASFMFTFLPELAALRAALEEATDADEPPKDGGRSQSGSAGSIDGSATTIDIRRPAATAAPEHMAPAAQLDTMEPDTEVVVDLTAEPQDAESEEPPTESDAAGATPEDDATATDVPGDTAGGDRASSDATEDADVAEDEARDPDTTDVGQESVDAEDVRADEPPSRTRAEDPPPRIPDSRTEAARLIEQVRSATQSGTAAGRDNPPPPATPPTASNDTEADADEPRRRIPRSRFDLPKPPVDPIQPDPASPARQRVTDDSADRALRMRHRSPGLLSRLGDMVRRPTASETCTHEYEAGPTQAGIRTSVCVHCRHVSITPVTGPRSSTDPDTAVATNGLPVGAPSTDQTMTDAPLQTDEPVAVDPPIDPPVEQDAPDAGQVDGSGRDEPAETHAEPVASQTENSATDSAQLDEVRRRLAAAAGAERSASAASAPKPATADGPDASAQVATDGLDDTSRAPSTPDAGSTDIGSAHAPNSGDDPIEVTTETPVSDIGGSAPEAHTVPTEAGAPATGTEPTSAPRVVPAAATSGAATAPDITPTPADVPEPTVQDVPVPDVLEPEVAVPEAVVPEPTTPVPASPEPAAETPIPDVTPQLPDQPDGERVASVTPLPTAFSDGPAPTTDTISPAERTVSPEPPQTPPAPAPAPRRATPRTPSPERNVTPPAAKSDLLREARARRERFRQRSNTGYRPRR